MEEDEGEGGGREGVSSAFLLTLALPSYLKSDSSCYCIGADPQRAKTLSRRPLFCLAFSRKAA